MTRESLTTEIADLDSAIHDLVQWTNSNHASPDWGEKYKKLTELIRHRRHLANKIVSIEQLTTVK